MLTQQINLKTISNNNKMNEEEKQALLLKYKDMFDKFNNIESEDIHNYDVMSFGEWLWSSFYAEDILTRSLSKIYHELSISSQPYSKFILYFKENNWHKYDSHNPYPIQHNLSSSLNNYELFKLIKHRLNALEKRYTHSFISRRINRFQDDETLTEEEVKFLQYSADHYVNVMQSHRDDAK